MIELNKGQKIAGYVFAGLFVIIGFAALNAQQGLAGIIGLAISAGLVIWCLYKKPK